MPSREITQKEAASAPAPPSEVRKPISGRWYWLAAAVVVLPIVAVAGIYLHHEQVVRPRMLQEAGSLNLGLMVTDVPAESLIPHPSGSANAAFHYVLALNEYNRRREPYIAARGLKPVIEEPPTNLQELHELARGAEQQDCDLYEEREGKPRFVFTIEPGGKPWPMHPASDPFEIRPYAGPVRTLAQAALNWGKKREAAGKQADGERAYQIVARMARHLRQRPGSLLDVELGIEIEVRALHYLEKLYQVHGNKARLHACWRYQDSVSKLQRDVRRKYAQLDNVEAAREVLAHDSERVWRISAGAALVAAQHYRQMGRLEARNMRVALGRAMHDRDPIVRQAVKTLVEMPESEFHYDETEAPAKR